MPRKRNLYMVLDTETATLPFANEIAGNNAELKKKIAIARPLIYDIGWTICDREGNIYKKQQFLITETFSIPSVFSTAYYASKRPLYLEMINRGEIDCIPWKVATKELENDLENVKAIGCFNSMFDLAKAIPFTELYINKLYSPDFNNWEALQYELCQKIISQPYKKVKDNFDPEHFTFRNKEYDCFDVWGMACERLLNTNKYKEKCLEYGMLTNSGDYFKSSAESAYRHLKEQFSFNESHTALADAEIETYILSKCLRNKGMKYGIDFFPFRKLGHPNEFVEQMRSKEKKKRFAEKVYQAIYDYLGDDWEDENITGYRKSMKTKAEELAKLF